MAHGTEVRTSHPAMDAWRPQAERMTYGDAGWLGAAWGLAGHATIHFFSVPIPWMERLLVLFAPAENLAFGLTRSAAPIGRWALVLVSVAVFWAIAACGILGAWREIERALGRVPIDEGVEAFVEVQPVHR